MADKDIRDVFRKIIEEKGDRMIQHDRDHIEQNNATSANIIVCPSCKEPYYAGSSHTCP